MNFFSKTVIFKIIKGAHGAQGYSLKHRDTQKIGWSTCWSPGGLPKFPQGTPVPSFQAMHLISSTLTCKDLWDTVLVSCGCWNNWPQFDGLKQHKYITLAFWGQGVGGGQLSKSSLSGPKSGHWQGCVPPSGGSRGEAESLPYQLLEAASIPWTAIPSLPSPKPAAENLLISGANLSFPSHIFHVWFSCSTYQDRSDYIGCTWGSQHPFLIHLQSPFCQVKWHISRFWGIGLGCVHLQGAIIQPTTPWREISKVQSRVLDSCLFKGKRKRKRVNSHVLAKVA